MEHISSEMLMDYFGGKLSEEQEAQIEGHLAECQDCTQRARQVLAFGFVWDRWTAKVHGETYWSARLATAVQEAENRVKNPSWRERLARWREQWAGRAEAAVRVIMAVSEEASRIVTEGLESLLRPGGSRQFALARVPIRTRGKVTRGTPQAPMEALARGKPQIRLTISGRTREIRIRVEDLPPLKPAPLVLLIPIEEGACPLVAEPQRVAGANYLIARFKGVPPGEYIAAFEPYSAPSPQPD